MGYLKGTIQSTMQTDLPPGSIIRIIVFRVPTTPAQLNGLQHIQRRAPVADMIGRAEITNARQFPVDFGINYDDVIAPSRPTSSSDSSSSDFAVYLTVYVEKGSRILLSNLDENRAASSSTPTSAKSVDIDPLIAANAAASSPTRTSRVMHLGSEYGDLIGRNGKFRRHLDVFLSDSTGRN